MTRSHAVVSGRAGQLLSACTGAFPFACALVLTPPSALRAPSRSLRRSLPFSPYFLHLPSARLGQVEGAFEGEGSRGWEQSRRGGWQKTTRPRAWAMCPMRGREPLAALRPGARHGSTAQHGQGAHVEGAPWLLSGSEGEQQGSHQEGRLMTMFLITTWR